MKMNVHYLNEIRRGYPIIIIRKRVNYLFDGCWQFLPRVVLSDLVFHVWVHVVCWFGQSMMLSSVIICLSYDQISTTHYFYLTCWKVLSGSEICKEYFDWLIQILCPIKTRFLFSFGITVVYKWLPPTKTFAKKVRYMKKKEVKQCFLA